MAKIKHQGKRRRAAGRRNGLRNADAGPRNRPATRASSEPRAEAVSVRRGLSELPDTPGWKAIKTAGGALVASLACAYVARENWLPPRAVTGVVSAVGATLAVGGSKEGHRDVGLGMMSAAGSQLALLTIDNHIATTGDKTAEMASVGGKPRPANVDTLPPGALEAAYRRARERLAITQAVSRPPA